MPEPVTAATARTLDWGRTRYTDAWERQQACVLQRLAGGIDDTLIFTEHEPVFTLGLRTGADAHLVWDRERLAREGIEVVKTNRGGDITYHGPGQIVGYPIVSLATRRDLHAYLRFLEQVLIDTDAMQLELVWKGDLPAHGRIPELTFFECTREGGRR